MTTKAFLTFLKLEIATAALANLPSPIVMNEIKECTDLPGLGVDNPLLRATHFQSTSEEYIAGLKDGKEFQTTHNDIFESPDIQKTVRGYHNSGAKRWMRVTITDTTNTTNSPLATHVFTFDVVCMGWEMAPALAGVEQVLFKWKISGDITEA